MILALDVLGTSAELRVLAEDDCGHVVIAQVSGQLLRVAQFCKECIEPCKMLTSN